MPAPQSAPAEPAIVTADRDPELSRRLDQELDAFNDVAVGKLDRTSFSVKAVDADGELIGGLTGWTWGGLCGISMLWVREASRAAGWGAKLLRAAEQEALRRGCNRVVVASFTFQAPGFYLKHGYVETGRMLGIPGGHEDVQLFKRLTEDGDFTV